MNTDHPKNNKMKRPNTKKKPANPANHSMSPHRNNPMTFARFWSIFIGAAEALASIWVSHFLPAYAMLYDSKNVTTEILIQIAYQTEFIRAQVRII